MSQERMMVKCVMFMSISYLLPKATGEKMIRLMKEKYENQKKRDATLYDDTHVTAMECSIEHITDQN